MSDSTRPTLATMSTELPLTNSSRVATLHLNLASNEVSIEMPAMMRTPKVRLLDLVHRVHALQAQAEQQGGRGAPPPPPR